MRKWKQIMKKQKERKKYIEKIININNDFKLNINILKDLENTMKRNN